MGVYIKCMEMPKLCMDCFGFNHEYNFCSVTDKDVDCALPNWCPLVAVPPHGDLIDYDFCMQNYELLHDDDGNPVYAVRMREINSAPTVIPAEPPKEE